jgi:outer membrane protein assembly factor BamA
LLLFFCSSTTYAQVGEPIVEVVVQQEGRGVTDPLVLGLIATTVGEPLAMRDVRETIEHLTSLRRYDDIQPTAENVPGGVRITYVLFPSHPVDRVEFTGTLGVPESDLRRLLTDRYGRAPAAGRAAEAVDLLRRTYRSRGYPAATVVTRIEEAHNPDRATLIFQIEAGRRARIADVRFVQLDEDATTTITGIPAIRIGDPYDSETVDQQLREWENDLRERGYYEARASHAADIADDAYLRVTFRRGPRVQVAFAGDALPGSEQERLVPVRTEASADEDLLEDSALAIQRYLNERGYRDATARYTRTETPGELIITFTVTRGAHYTIDSVTVTGNGPGRGRGARPAQSRDRRAVRRRDAEGTSGRAAECLPRPRAHACHRGAGASGAAAVLARCGRPAGRGSHPDRRRAPRRRPRGRVHG